MKDKRMKLLPRAALVGALLVFSAAALALPASLVTPSGARAQVTPAVIYANTFPIPGSLPVPPAPFDLFHVVLDIPAGGRTGSHSHPFGCVQTVIQGQVTNRIGNSGFVASAGQKLIFFANSFGTHENDSASNAKALASGFTQVGAPISTAEAGAAAPTIAATSFSARTTVTEASGPQQIVQVYAEFPAGAASPPQRANGPGLVSVIEGEITLTVAGSETKLGAGQSAPDRTGQVHEARNTGSGTAKVVTTYLVPAGVTPLTPVAASAQLAPPRTGDGGLLAGPEGRDFLAVAILAIGMPMLLVGGAALVRRARPTAFSKHVK